MFHVKICGVTSPSDARSIAMSGADALGLNFYPKSRRYIEITTARKIVAELPSSVIKVGVFVNATLDEILEITQEVALDVVQLHGDETAEFAQEIRLPIMKAFRIDERGLNPLASFLAACRDLGRVPDLCLLDACQPGEYGGTGVQLDWKKLATEMSDLPRHPILKGLTIPPIVISGGLNSSNVAEAILTCRPWGVDVASGVERSPGQKDSTLVQAFVSSAKSALAAVGRSR